MSSPIPIVIFAQTPPPEHGQSRMVLLALDAIRHMPDDFEVHHVNAQFSSSLEEIGDSSLNKFLLTLKYLAQAVRMRLKVGGALLYYVPGPVKWTAVLRDWVLLSALRTFYPQVIFHWHAIGQGEWAHGSTRQTLPGPRWLDWAARKVSARVINKPYASIAVSHNSRRDAIAVGSRQERVIWNGIEDPCPDFDESLKRLQIASQQRLATAACPCFKILFLSHGTEEKGLLDALDCLAVVLENSLELWHFQVTFAGGVSNTLHQEFNLSIASLKSRWGARIEIKEEGYVSGRDKHRCFISHDIFLAPSRWESFGLTVIEAMAYNMQIVATASDGVTGVLPEAYPYLSPVCDPTALANNLLICCANLRAKNYQNLELRDRFLECFQIKDFARNLTSALLQLSDRHVVSTPGIPHAQPSTHSSSPSQFPLAAFQVSALSPPLRITAYLADQNPGHDRSYGISRMSQVVLGALAATGEVEIEAITSKTSQQAPTGVGDARILPWGTRRKWVRLLTDHFYPLFANRGGAVGVHYFPKGYLPLLSGLCRPSVVTIHDTIIQYDEDRYPDWRSRWEYSYWSWMLKHTLYSAEVILTVSESAKSQIQAFMDRHRIAPKEITVTFEPCVYEALPQPVEPEKKNYVIHLASCEPHKRTAHLIRWWCEAEARGGDLPMLHLIGTAPAEVHGLLASSRSIVKLPFLEEGALQAAYQAARALILPSEIEGFGLPALEAYYLGTPVCFVRGTSVEEVLSVATSKGGFRLEDLESLETALAEVMAMTEAEVRDCGLKLRETYAAEKVVARMLAVFEKTGKR